MPQNAASRPSDVLVVAAAQIAPVWLDRDATIAKVVARVDEAAERGCALVCFGETLVPGYPMWLAYTDGAAWELPIHKAVHARYLQQGVDIEAGHLDPVRDAARRGRIAVYVGVLERPRDRGGKSGYASLVYIDAEGEVRSVHRKLQPTYDERMTWSPGDGNGLRTHPLGAFTVGGLNCWENWMPLPRAALYGLGEDLHVAAWPGSCSLQRDITRFIALEGRSYVISVGSVIRPQDVAEDVPFRDEIVAAIPDMLFDGGSCIAAPDGSWLVPPCSGEETLLVATIDHAVVLGERQNFDPSGHYSRPDVTRLVVDRTRQATVEVHER